jgi:hypothetical protein
VGLSICTFIIFSHHENYHPNLTAMVLVHRIFFFAIAESPIENWFSITETRVHRIFTYSVFQLSKVRECEVQWGAEHPTVLHTLEKGYMSLPLEKFITSPRSRLLAWNGGSEALPQVNLKGGRASDLPFPGRAVETRYFQIYLLQE